MTESREGGFSDTSEISLCVIKSISVSSGQKDRPCAIVAALRLDENGDTRGLVLPITHTPPDHPALAVEIPFKVKNRLQLDDARSWVVLSEWNESVWPGPDLRQLAGRDRRLRCLWHAAAGLVRGDPRPVSGDRQFGQRAACASELSA